jgi:adenine deaminase
MTETLASWPEVAADLIAVAARRAPADMVIRDCVWVNVHSRELLPGSDIAIKAGRFASCGPDARAMIGPETQVIDAKGRYLIPGLCDGHMHIESGMLTISQFARAVMPHGTTTMFTDPHEVANVLGLPGVRLMHDEALAQPINVFVQMPSCALPRRGSRRRAPRSRPRTWPRRCAGPASSGSAR